MNASIAQRLFRCIAECAGGETDIDVDAIEAGIPLGVPPVDLFALVDDLIARGLLMDIPEITWGKFNVRLTAQGRDTYTREHSP